MTTPKPISVRPDEKMNKAIAALRRWSDDPIPSVSDVIRDAVMEKFERVAKANGHKPQRNDK